MAKRKKKYPSQKTKHSKQNAARKRAGQLAALPSRLNRTPQNSASARPQSEPQPSPQSQPKPKPWSGLLSRRSNQGTTPTPGGPIVKVANGAGNPAVPIAWQEGDTVATVLSRANIVIDSDRSAMLNRRLVRSPSKTAVQPGETIVVARRPSNG